MFGRSFGGFVVLAVLGLSAISLGATYGGGSGTVADPYQIWTAEQMNTIGANSADWDNHFKLMDNIDMSAYTGTEYKIIGNSNTNFTGGFDGNSHVISNLTYVTTATVDYVGLFGVISGATIENLGIVNVSISTGGQSVGSLVGFQSSGIIASCYMEGSINGSDNIGGLVGKNSGTISGCCARGKVMGVKSLVGGLVGLNENGAITSSFSKSTVTGSAYVGGLTGWNMSGSITACYSTGETSGSYDYIGGLVGYNSAGMIIACYATGGVSGISYIGGLIGYNYVGDVKGCYAASLVSSANVYAGGLIGANSGEVVSSFWDVETSGKTKSGGGTGKTTADMQMLSTFSSAGWDFINETADGRHDYWQMNSNNYPVLVFHNWTLQGEGTLNNPYLVSNPSDLTKVWLRPFSCYHLTDNIDLNGITWSTSLVPLFCGVFDGCSFVISNIKINPVGNNNKNIGLFGRLSQAVVQNLGIENIDVNGRYYVGGLAGRSYQSSITSCYITGNTSGYSVVGGLVGSCYSDTIALCYTSDSVKGSDSVGGLVGENSFGIILSCYTTGLVNGSSDTGGLVGENDGTIVSCHASCPVIGTSNVGGLVGINDYGTITNSHSSGSVNGLSNVGGLAGSNANKLTFCYATGTVTGSDTIGGLVGWNGGNDYFATLTSCYATGCVVGKNAVGGLVGRNGNDFDPGTIKFCYATGSILGENAVGGLAGVSSSSTILLCYATGDVNGTSGVGGLAGHVIYCTITSSCCTGEVSGLSDNTGGLIGKNSYGTVTDCYTTSSVGGTSNVGGLVGYNNEGWITSCYATGAVSGSSVVGGLVGYRLNGMIKSSFWNTQTTELNHGIGSGYSTGTYGKTTEEMQMLSTFSDAGWDFAGEAANGANDYWRMCADGVGYPRLSWEFGRGGDFACPDGVGVEDLEALAAKWLTIQGQAGYHSACDANGDGRIDMGDFEVLAEGWMGN